MSEPIRYLDRGDSSLAKSLLRSAEVDRPTSRSLERSLRTAAAAAAATTVTASGAAATSASALWLKWLGIGLLTGGLAIGTSTLVSRGHLQSAETPAPASEPKSPAAPLVTQPEPASPPAAAPLPALSQTPPERHAESVRARARSSSVAEPPATDSLARELARVDAARRELASGNAKAAIAELDGYDKEFPRARFGEESALIRAEALVKIGDCAKALAYADAFGGGSGKSVLDRRWKALRASCR